MMIQTLTQRPPSHWDHIDPNSLLRLVNYRKMSTEFGYLLRHYWIPASQLTLQTTTCQKIPGKKSLNAVKWTEQRMAKCDADQCVWREKVRRIDHENQYMVHFSRPRVDEHICTYNRSEQTFRSHHVKQFTPLPEQEHDARNEAFLQQPLLTPLLPIPLGFTWHVRNEEGYLEWTLESVKNVGGMTVLFIRRHGEIFLDTMYLSGHACPSRYCIHRQGVTAYALERSMILEDRTYDRLESFDSSCFADGMETWRTTQLILSEYTE